MMRSVLKSLRVRLVGLVLLAVVPALVLAYYSGMQQRHQAVASAQEEALQIAHLISADQEQVIESTHHVLVTLAHLPALWDGDAAGCPSWLAHLSDHYDMVSGLEMATPEGDVFCSTLGVTQPVNFADRDWFQRVVETRDFVVSGYQIGRLSGQPIIVLAQPVVDAAGVVRAVLSVGVDLPRLEQWVTETGLPVGSALTIVGRQGTILARYPDGDTWAGRVVPQTPLLDEILALSGDGMTEARGLDGVPRFYGFAALTGERSAAAEGIDIAVGIPKAAALREANRQMARDLSLLGLAAVLAVEAAWFAGGRYLVRPVKSMVSAAESLAAGDLSAHTGLGEGLGEMSRLGGALDRTATSLRQREAERDRAKQNLQQANRALRVLSTASQTVLRASDEAQLLHETCNVIVNAGGYRLAWAGMTRGDGEEGLRLATCAQGNGGGPGHDAPPWRPERQDQDFALSALRTGEPVVHRNGAVDLGSAAEGEGVGHWRYGAALALPLVSEHETLGVLGIHAAQPDAFERGELRLLEELADNVAYGVRARRMYAEWEWTQVALEESEQQYRMLFHEMLSGFALYEIISGDDGRLSDCRFLVLNPAFERLTGLHARDVIGRTMREVLPDTNPGWFERCGHVAQTGQPTQFEDYFAELGRYFDIRAFRPGRGRLAVTFHDSTERKQAERAVVQQLARTSLLNQIARAIAERQDLASILRVVVNRLEDELAVDCGFAATYDPERKAFIATVCGAGAPSSASDVGLVEGIVVSTRQAWLAPVLEGQLVYVSDTTGVDAPLMQQLASLGIRSLATTPLMVEGQLLGALFTSRRVADGFGTAELDFLRAMSEHVAVAAYQARLHEDLQVAYDDLRQTQLAAMEQERLRALGEMASGIAHDINNAISPAVIFAELLRREPSLDARARGMVDDIRASCNDVAQMLARLRQFYREPETEALAPVDLNQAVQQVIALSRPRWRDMPQSDGIVIAVQTELSPDLPAVMGVESEVREALTNLVLNAVDAMPQGGTLRIRTHTDGWTGAESPVCAMVEVDDTGIGMDEETRRRCLEPFFTTKGSQGTGLGLSVVHGIVQRHQGHLEIDSVPGEGTSIRLLFPLRTLAGPKEAASEGVGPRTSLHILCVDDEPVLRRALTKMLEKDGHTVEAADSGQAGIDAFRAARARGAPFDVVITDLGMPRVSGRDVARAVKKDAPTTGIIMLTGWGRSPDASEIPPHVDWILSKPPHIEELRRAMAGVGDDYARKRPA